jgi:hypothetical protein
MDIVIWGEGSHLTSKGQLISKCLFGVIVWTKKPFSRISEPLKRSQIKKIRALYYTN